jgi:hypothetical protein
MTRSPLRGLLVAALIVLLAPAAGTAGQDPSPHTYGLNMGRFR